MTFRCTLKPYVYIYISQDQSEPGSTYTVYFYYYYISKEYEYVFLHCAFHCVRNWDTEVSCCVELPSSGEVTLLLIRNV